MPLQPSQPLLHDLVTCVSAPTTVLSGADGQVTPTGGQGAFHADVRVLSAARLLVDGRDPDAVRAVLDGPSAARFTSLARWLGDRGADPSVRIERFRAADSAGLRERIVVTSTADTPVESGATLDLEVDFAAIDDVKAGAWPPAATAAEVTNGTATWRSASGVGVEVVVDVGDAVLTPHDGGVRLSWPLTLMPGSSYELGWRLAVSDPAAVVARPAAAAPWSRPQVRADDRRLERLVERAMDDLESLRLVLRSRPDDQFLAAGSPWFLTLFGRDSLWAARMMLPLGTDLAAGTLTALASLQGSNEDDSNDESPGKIMHELRRGDFGLNEFRDGVGVVLPPVYYGTVDATALWIVLLHDAWRWGLAAERVEPLLPALEAAVGWLTGPADADGDGFLEYVDRSGHGLANQGWKDSGDSVRFRDGTLAKGPIALVEVQGYAYEAAGCAAALLTSFGRPGADRLLSWRDSLAERFRRSFWVEDDGGSYPAMALDGSKRAVDAVTSNIGHLLGTGILSRDEAAAVAARLAQGDMDCGYGLRTMSSADGGFSPLSYHCGTVWPHDTAIVVSGLVREGLTELAASLVDGLLAAGDRFEGRLPELWAGDQADAVRGPVPYPAACRPQAWSAAAAVSVLRDLVGLSADVPGGLLGIAPLSPGPAGAVSVRGLQVGGQAVGLETERDGRLIRLDAPPGLQVRTGRSAEGATPGPESVVAST